MADDGPSAAEDATAAVVTGLGDGDSRVTRERHKRADATTPIVTPGPFLSSGQDACSSAKRVGGHEDASTVASPCEADDHHRPLHERRVHHRHQHPHCHSYHHLSPHRYTHHHFNPHRHYLTNHRDNGDDRVSDDRGSGDSPSPVDATTGPTASDDDDDDDDEEGNGDGGGGDSGGSGGGDGGGSSDGIGFGAPCSSVGVGADGDGGNGSGSVGLYHDDVRIEIVRNVVAEDDPDDGSGGGNGSVGGVDSDCDGDSGGSSNSINSSKSGAGGVAEIMTGGNNNNAATRVGVENADGAVDGTLSSTPRRSADSAPEVNDRGDRDGRRRASIAVATREKETRANEDAAASAKTNNGGVAVARHRSSPFKGQVRMAEDTLVGPCSKKRCADRYDSSESSDR